MDMIKCKALDHFTEFVDGLGQVHGDPNNSDERVSHPLVPAHIVDGLIERGKIEVLGDGAEFSAPISSGEDLVTFAMEHVGGGRFSITGPGLVEPEIVKGKDKAQARVDELKAAALPVADDAAPVA